MLLSADDKLAKNRRHISDAGLSASGFDSRLWFGGYFFSSLKID
jgi:hypothetical protein